MVASYRYCSLGSWVPLRHSVALSSCLCIDAISRLRAFNGGFRVRLSSQDTSAQGVMVQTYSGPWMLDAAMGLATRYLEVYGT